jgi:hypothetical protein
MFNGAPTARRSETWERWKHWPPVQNYLACGESGDFARGRANVFERSRQRTRVYLSS